MSEEKKKILIVDDDTFLVDMYTFKFSQRGFEVEGAGNGVQALEKLASGVNPDVILFDIIMPEMDGFEMLEEINAKNISPTSIKIILSNKSEQADIDRGNSMGVSGYIIKANSTPSEVVEQVLVILEKTSLVK